MGAFFVSNTPTKTRHHWRFFIVFDSLQQHKNKRQNNATDELLYLTSIYPLLNTLTRLKRVILRYGVLLIIGFYSCFMIRV